MKKSKIEKGCTYNGIFKPKRLEKLDPEYRDIVGKEGLFTAIFLIDQGEYNGSWALVSDLKEGYYLDRDIQFLSEDKEVNVHFSYDNLEDKETE